MGQILFDNLERNKQQFIESANNKHNNKYDYSLINYINTHTKVKIICPIHGVFEQTPSRHLNSNGCNKCRIQKISNLDEFINKSRKIHGDLYDYSLVNYTNNDTPVIIICKKHGEFQVRPRSHTSSKSGCPKCWKKYDLSPIDRSKIKFNNKFTYNNGLVICPIHGNTGYSIHEHLKTTHGCNKCYEDSRRMLIPEYLERANKIHNNKYQYELLNFKSVSDEIKIICPIHGEFKQKAGAHLYEKKGCRQCSHNKMSLEEFINKAIEIHGNKYDYSKVVYNGIDSKIDSICKKIIYLSDPKLFDIIVDTITKFHH